MRRPLSFLVAFTVAAGLVGAAEAATQCRDAAGKFVKCPPASTSGGTCRDTAGKFVKCGTPGAMPASAAQSKSAMASGSNAASKSKPPAKNTKPKSTNTVGPAPK